MPPQRQRSTEARRANRRDLHPYLEERTDSRLLTHIENVPKLAAGTRARKTVAIAGHTTERSWAPIRVHSVHRPEIPDHARRKTERVYELQSEDDVRFDAAIAGLLGRLDLSDGAVTAMTCDHEFVPLLENWAASCDRSGIECRAATVVFPTDRDAFDRIESLGFVTYFDEESQFLSEMTQSAAYGDTAWTDYMYHQNWVIKKLLGFPADVLFQDVDLVWRYDPIPHLRRQASDGVDIQAMYNGPNPRY